MVLSLLRGKRSIQDMGAVFSWFKKALRCSETEPALSIKSSSSPEPMFFVQANSHACLCFKLNGLL